jgi:hypothetical protein
MSAVLRDDAGAVSSFIMGGFNAWTRDPDGNTPLMVASIVGSAAVATVLLGSAATTARDDSSLVDACNAYGRTALMNAATSCGDKPCIATIEALLASRANLEATDKQGKTPLLLAAQYGRDKCLKRLLDAKANVAALETTTRYNAAMRACTSYKHTTVRLLLVAGCDFEHINAAGDTLSDMAPNDAIRLVCDEFRADVRAAALECKLRADVVAAAAALAAGKADVAKAQAQRAAASAALDAARADVAADATTAEAEDAASAVAASSVTAQAPSSASATQQEQQQQEQP